MMIEDVAKIVGSGIFKDTTTHKVVWKEAVVVTAAQTQMNFLQK